MMPQDLYSALEPLLQILNEIDGYLVFKDSEGNNYVLGRVEDILEEDDEDSEIQLSLPTVPSENNRTSQSGAATADELLDRINREIALFQIQQEDEAEMDTMEETPEPPKRIRFEPLRGDLPPELQE